ncbi:dipeptide/oligopeptide/nickel ABC transporter ATP-binding protein [Aminipila sp.]|uniref:dipeptide/oligopeptide/nickel ABC transporter ATP-binding protein n=1 Tax=Aminipila sp. TaxID=2060095 RepID=UPI00289B4568|nr:dipeptide/oligopeptide/nickel ABC transporter ATP-binding protein [Aminipila sp.]
MEGIIVQNVFKFYGTKKEASFAALKGVDMQLNPGEYVALVGESGSGKSTIARLIIGLEKATSGHILLDGEDTGGWNYKRWRSNRKKIQAVFQDTSGTLNPRLSVYQNVEQALVNLTSLSKKQRRERIFELMALTNMDRRLLEVPTRQLSGGEQRRLSLLRALSIRPDYLILDEVISGLDLISADAVLKVLEKYHEEYSCACLFVTHDKESAYRISDRILEINNGKIMREAIKN